MAEVFKDAKSWILEAMRTVLSFFPAVMWVVNASAASLVVGLPASNHNAFPFGGGVGGSPATRYQQAYAASDFATIGAPFQITAIDFLNGAGTLAPSTYTVYFSTITAGIDSLSNVNFDGNRGPDNTLFANLTLSGLAPTTLTFSGTPFFYDSAHGNLLLDIVVSPGGVDANSGFGGRYLSSESATGVFSRYHNFGVGTVGWGLVTQFDYLPIPEPSSAPLACIALIVAGTCRRLIPIPSRRPLR